MDKYTDVCSKGYVKRCLRFCESADPLMGKTLTPCEELKCMMYCAKAWSNECASAVGKYCRDKTSNDTVVYGEGIEDTFIRYPECDVDCNSAPPRSIAATIVAAIAMLHIGFHSALIERRNVCLQ